MDDHKYKNQFWGYSVKTSVRKTGRTTFTEKSPISMSAAVVNDEYNGQFKVIDATGDDGVFRVRVVNGADPESVYCGYTDIAGNVESKTITPNSSGYIVAYAEWNSEQNKYIVNIDFVKSPSSYNAVIELASINSENKINQLWMDNSIYWKEFYFV